MLPFSMLVAASCINLITAKSVSSSISTSLSDSEGPGSRKSVSFAKLVPNDDFVSAVKKTKKLQSSEKHHRHHHHHQKHHKSHHKSSPIKELKDQSYFSTSKPIFREFSYIAESGSRQPRLPGGPQKVGFTFSRSWQRQVERDLLKGKKKRSSDKPPNAISNGYASKFASQTKGVVEDPIDAGWWLVSFEAGRSDALNSFKFKNKRPVIVSVVDLFCRGDSFAVLDGGKLIAQTGRVRADSKCRDIATSPQVAIQDGRWSSVVFDLEPGKHTITLRVIDNSFEGGMVAVRFEHKAIERDSDESSDDAIGSSSTTSETSSSCSSDSDDKKPRIHLSRSQVCSGYNGFVVIDLPLSMKNADKACAKIKARVANLNGKQDNYKAAVKSIYSCLGAKVAWVDAKDNDGIADLVLKVEKKGKSGSLTPPNGKHPVLCEVKQ